LRQAIAGKMPDDLADLFLRINESRTSRKVSAGGLQLADLAQRSFQNRIVGQERPQRFSESFIELVGKPW
jgi:hypothetical protein